MKKKLVHLYQELSVDPSTRFSEHRAPYHHDSAGTQWRVTLTVLIAVWHSNTVLTQITNQPEGPPDSPLIPPQ